MIERKKGEARFGMILILRDAEDKSIFNRFIVEARSPNQTLEHALAEALTNMNNKREAWRKIFPDITFEVVQIV